MSEPETITDLLVAWNAGDPAALERLLPLVERELHKLAARYMRRERTDHTLQTTALMNEAYLKLVEQNRVQWQNRTHFFAISAQIMRRILLDYAKAQSRLKRGAAGEKIELDQVMLISPANIESIIVLDEALNRLAEMDLLKSRIVELRHFGGLSVEETAEVLEVAPVTVMRHWSLAKAWLRRELRNENNFR